MTESEWLACDDPTPMLDFVSKSISGRKSQLFAVACCRHIDVLLDDACRNTLSELERVVDTAVDFTNDGIKELSTDAMAHADGLSYHMGTPLGCARWLAANAVWDASEGTETTAAEQAAQAAYIAKLEPSTFDVTCPAPPSPGDVRELAAQATFLRDVFGNPFRRVAFSRKWRTETALALARQMYESRDFSAMPILADALQDAGCDNADVLNHCRQPGEHVRGCWCVDLLLGKS